MTTVTYPVVELVVDAAPVAGELTFEDEFGDVYEIDLEAGTTYRFEVHRTGGGFHPMLEGHVVPGGSGGFGGDIDPDPTTVVVYSLVKESRTFWLTVDAGYDLDPGNRTGTYTISAQAMADDQPGAVADARALIVDASVLSGTIDFAVDTDLFVTHLVKGQAYMLEAKGLGGGLDPAIANLKANGLGTVLVSTGFNTDDSTARIYFIAGFDADYYLGVSSDHSTTGGYTISGAAINSVLAVGESDTLTGTAGPDIIYGRSGANVMRGNGGDDFFDGDDGRDVAVYGGPLSNYQIEGLGFRRWVVSDTKGTDGQDVLQNVERLRFSDANVALDVIGTAGHVVRVLGAVFGQEAAHNPWYVGMGIQFMESDSNSSLTQAAIDLRFGPDHPSDEDVIHLVLLNILGVEPFPEVVASALALVDEYGLVAIVDAGAHSYYNELSIGYDAMKEHGILYF